MEWKRHAGNTDWIKWQEQAQAFCSHGQERAILLGHSPMSLAQPAPVTPDTALQAAHIFGHGQRSNKPKSAPPLTLALSGLTTAQ